MLGAEVAWLTRSAAERGEVADLESSMKDSRALRAFCCVGSIVMIGWLEADGCFQMDIKLWSM